MDSKTAEQLPRYSLLPQPPPRRRRRRHGPPKLVKLLILASIVYLVYTSPWSARKTEPAPQLLSLDRLQADHSHCTQLRAVPSDPAGHRDRSARYVEGKPPVLIRNATIWTGEPAPDTSEHDARLGKGYSWITADVFLEHGLIKRVEREVSQKDLPESTEVYEANGRLLTAGIVDMHSHAGVDGLPELNGKDDTNELSSDITPYVRSIDGLDPLDHQLQVIKSGGVTTSLILPGSGNNMGGEAFVIKHAVGKPDGRAEMGVEDMLADPEKHWRYMKMACGENAKNVYGTVGRDFGPFSRMGEAWYFRHAFEQATAMVNAQDDWCAAADRLGAANMREYLPRELKWESLGALLRGQVRLNTHCYTITDLESFVKHTNEFKFIVRAFHHAHQTYLVPEVLKRAYGGRPPAAALFADNGNYKVEAYNFSEQAGRILWENGITPTYVSDNPVINAQHVVFEAAKAYRNGLPYHVALAGVTTASAELLGLGNRIGKVKPGFDADIVVWDSDPLSVGAAPVQVWIDGSAQFADPVELKKPQPVPIKPMPVSPLLDPEVSEPEVLIISKVAGILLTGYDTTYSSEQTSIVVHNGSIVCVGDCAEQARISSQAHPLKTKNITPQSGSAYLYPTLTAFGSTLGLSEIDQEPDTQDGFNNEGSFSRAVDGLILGGKNMDAAYSRGVTTAITAPLYHHGGFKGISVAFATGCSRGSHTSPVLQDEVALHYTISKTEKIPTLSGAIGALRESLLKASRSTSPDPGTPEEASLKKVIAGDLPLVVSAQSADMIASLLRLKSEVEHSIQPPRSIRMIIHGAAESHLLASELAKANVGILLAPYQAYAQSWSQRRLLPGAPLSNGTTLDVLHAAGVKVAISTAEDSQVRDLYLSAGIAYANGNGKISEREAIGFVSSNVYEMLGVEEEGEGLGENRREEGRRTTDSFVVFDGHPLTIEGQVKAVADGSGRVTVWS